MPERRMWMIDILEYLTIYEVHHTPWLYVWDHIRKAISFVEIAELISESLET